MIVRAKLLLENSRYSVYRSYKIALLSHPDLTRSRPVNTPNKQKLCEISFATTRTQVCVFPALLVCRHGVQ